MTDKSLFRALVLDLVLAIALLFYVLRPVHAVPEELPMSAANAALTRGAISLVINEIQNGKITSYDIAIQALKSELPLTVQDDVLKRLQDSTFATISDDMVELAGLIRVQED